MAKKWREPLQEYTAYEKDSALIGRIRHEIKKTTIDIVINVYNAQKTIDQFMDSLSKQTCKKFHLIIVDNGYTDSTIENIERYKNAFDTTLFRSP